MKNYTYSVYIILLLVFINACSGGRRSTEITQDELTKHIRYLTSDELAGRLTGTDGDSLAAEYIRKEECKRGYFLPNYEAFVRRCLDYFSDRHIEVYFYNERLDGAIESKMPLITLFKLDSSLCPRTSKEIKDSRKKNN